MRLITTLLLLAPLPAAALPEFDAVYDFERGRITIGETRLKLERTQDDIYRYTSESRAVGLISVFVDDVIREESIFHFDGGFWPVSYNYRHLGSDKNRNESIAYDWTDRVARINYRGHESATDLAPGMLDRFLLQLAITVDAQDGELRKQYRVIDNARIMDFRVRGGETEKVRTPAGEFETLRVERVDDDRDKTLRLWLAPTLDYLPVRIEQEKRNEEPMRLVLKKIDLAAQETSGG